MGGAYACSDSDDKVHCEAGVVAAHTALCSGQIKGIIFLTPTPPSPPVAVAGPRQRTDPALLTRSFTPPGPAGPTPTKQPVQA